MLTKYLLYQHTFCLALQQHQEPKNKTTNLYRSHPPWGHRASGARAGDYFRKPNGPNADSKKRNLSSHPKAENTKLHLLYIPQLPSRGAQPGLSRPRHHSQIPVPEEGSRIALSALEWTWCAQPTFLLCFMLFSCAHMQHMSVFWTDQGSAQGPIQDTTRKGGLQPVCKQCLIALRWAPAMRASIHENTLTHALFDHCSTPWISWALKR